MSTSVPLSGVDNLRSQIYELQEQLEKNLPGYASLLHTIHKNLAMDEQLVHLLKEEEIGIIVSGLAKRKNIVLAESSVKAGKNTTASGKKLKDIGLGDLL